MLVSGGLDFETAAGDERFVLGVCGDLGAAASAVVVVDDTEEARIEASDGGRFFCVPLAVAPVEEGVGPAVSLRPTGSLNVVDHITRTIEPTAPATE